MSCSLQVYETRTYAPNLKRETEGRNNEIPLEAKLQDYKSFKTHHSCVFSITGGK